MKKTLALLKKKRVWTGLAIATCLIVVISHLPIGAWLSAAHTWIAGQGVWAIPAFIGIYVLAAVFGLPNIVLILAAGTLFGLTKGVVIASVADVISIAACFAIGQNMGRRWITCFVGENSRFHKLDKAFAKKGWKIVLLTRLSPVLPSSLLNYGFSITRINFWEYLFFSWMGMLPVIFTYVYVGKFGASILSSSQQAENLVFQAIGLATTLGVMFYTTKLTASALRSEEDSSEDMPSAKHLCSSQASSDRTASNKDKPKNSKFDHKIDTQRSPSRSSLWPGHQACSDRRYPQTAVSERVLVLPKIPGER